MYIEQNHVINVWALSEQRIQGSRGVEMVPAAHYCHVPKKNCDHQLCYFWLYDMVVLTSPYAHQNYRCGFINVSLILVILSQRISIFPYPNTKEKKQSDHARLQYRMWREFVVTLCQSTPQKLNTYVRMYNTISMTMLRWLAYLGEESVPLHLWQHLFLLSCLSLWSYSDSNSNKSSCAANNCNLSLQNLSW